MFVENMNERGIPDPSGVAHSPLSYVSEFQMHS